MRSTAIALPPLLREGDRLDSTEFLRRWEAMPDLKHAELIDGVVFSMPSPVGLNHATICYRMSGWLCAYTDATPGCAGGVEATWIMGPVDVPQPDLCVRILREYGGQSGESGAYGSGAPELIVEVSGSTLSRDLGAKLELYRRAGVREYLSVLLNPQQVIWRELARGRYREIKPDEDGLLRSRVFPGLWLNSEAVWNAKKQMREAVQKGIASEGHAAFVRRLGVVQRRKG
jgi:Uma2 family endonuclease